MYKAAVAKRSNNHLLSMHPDFPVHLAAEIEALELEKVRFHEAGDVYSQAYLAKLYQVCRDLPWVGFLMYTKSMHLDWSGLPINLKRYWSIDKTSTMVAPAGPIAYLVSKGEAPPTGHVTCAHTLEKHYCGTECLICWQGTQDVYFNQH
jgi:hypothetical protein